jgi:predicted nucleic acid-binding protein
MIVLLDSGPLGLPSNPKQSAEADACKAWLRDLIAEGHRALVPSITDYEVRRELRLYGRANGLRRLDYLIATHGFLSLTDAALRQAADFWAAARRQGLPTADRFALDADVILAAQAVRLNPSDWGRPGDSGVIATTNVGHLSRFADARLWRGIP